MSRRAALITVAVAALLILVLGIWLWGGSGEPTSSAPPSSGERFPEESSERSPEEGADPLAPLSSETSAAELELFFPGPGKVLYAERRALVAGGSPGPGGEEGAQGVGAPQGSAAVRQRLRAVVEELLKGPEESGHRAPLPEGTTLISTYLGTGGVAFIDLQFPEENPRIASGSTEEMLTIFSVVNSVLRNVPEVRAVALLHNGTQPATFAGHVDTSRPLLANPRLLAR